MLTNRDVKTLTLEQLEKLAKDGQEIIKLLYQFETCDCDDSKKNWEHCSSERATCSICGLPFETRVIIDPRLINKYDEILEELKNRKKSSNA